MLAYTIGVFMIGTGLALRHPRTAALADFAGLERSCGAAARSLQRRVADLDSDGGRALLRGVVLLRRIADAVAAHGGFLRGRSD